jgi:flavin reductase (DIM6/NTAB) family NADH-FMN oxidoreductase RutF
MTKKKMDGIGKVKNPLYPYLPVVVGVNVNGRPNYITIGLIGWLCYDLIAVSLGHGQYSTPGLRENRTFSVNQPTAEMAAVVDYCGLRSGRDVDKGALFTNFYGDLETAPMIDECPVNIECRLVQTLERQHHAVFIGEVAAVHLDPAFTTGGRPDIEKIQPIFYAPDKSRPGRAGSYWALGEVLAPAWQVGKTVGKGENNPKGTN